MLCCLIKVLLAPTVNGIGLTLLLGSGAGHAIEDCYILGRALQAHFREGGSLATWMQVYQDVRLPRAQKAQATSRQAGDVYEMSGEQFEGLSYDECLPIVASQLKDRMKWVWGGNIDAEYEAVVKKDTRDSGAI